MLLHYNVLLNYGEWDIRFVFFRPKLNLMFSEIHFLLLSSVHNNGNYTSLVVIIFLVGSGKAHFGNYVETPS